MENQQEVQEMYESLKWYILTTASNMSTSCRIDFDECLSDATLAIVESFQSEPPEGLTRRAWARKCIYKRMGWARVRAFRHRERHPRAIEALARAGLDSVSDMDNSAGKGLPSLLESLSEAARTLALTIIEVAFDPEEPGDSARCHGCLGKAYAAVRRKGMSLRKLHKARQELKDALVANS